METPNAPSERRSTRRPLQRKYKAASPGSSPVRPSNVRTPSSVPGVTYNKTAWHVLSRRSNVAPTPTLAKRRRQYFASITTLWKYHGHRGRGTITARPKHGLNRTRGCRFFYFSLTFRTLLFERPVRQLNCRTKDARTREADKPCRITELPGGLYHEQYTCSAYHSAACPWNGHVKIVQSFAYHFICIILL